MKFGTFLSVGFLFGISLLLSGCPCTAPVTMQVVTTPYAVPNAGGTTLVYELLLSDYRVDHLTLTKVEVFADGALFRTFTREDFLSEEYAGPVALVLPSEGAADNDPMACTQPVLYFGIPLAEGEAVPASVSHTLHFVNGFCRSFSFEGGEGVPNAEPLLVIQPPLRGSRMAAMEAIAPRTHHRRGISMIDGQPFVSQRFAVDWFRLTEAGTMSDGSSTGNVAYPGYGEDILAVAPGIVVKITQGVPDNPTPPGRAVVITNDTIAGNLVVVRIAENRYVFYGHCIPGSILVQEGDEVVTGQVIAQMGNSGNSDAPHLHFQIADGTSLFEAQGIPYVFEQFSYDADFRYWGADADNFQAWVTGFTWTPLDAATPCAAEFVANGQVVTFE